MINKVLSVTSKAIGEVEKSKPLQWAERKFREDPEKALGIATVASIVIKDGVGCYKYVTQSMNNKKIPEEKRKFVAALDLTNGVLMILAQIGMFFAMRKFSEPIFNKLFKKSFNAENAKNIASKIRMQQQQAGQVVSRKLNIEKEYNNVKSDALKLFKFVADIAAATIIGKRVIVPFIATPLAAKVKQKMDMHEGLAPKNSEGAKQAEQGKKEDAAVKPEIHKLDITTTNTNLLKRYYNYH